MYVIRYEKYFVYDEIWWCNSHQRRAEYIMVNIENPLKQQHCCNPKLGGIMLPCSCVNLTGMVEIEDGA